MRRGTRIIPYRQAGEEGDMLYLFIRYPEGHIGLIASYLMPPDGNWRANDAFYDGLQELYKERLKNW